MNKKLIFFYLKYFFLTKKIWKKPSQKKILIYDAVSSSWLLKYLDKKQVEYYYTFRPGEMKINMYVLLKVILSGNINIDNYKRIYISAVNPDFIITLIDNNPAFYKLKKLCPNAKTIFIQNAYRMGLSDVFSKSFARTNYSVDHMFVFNSFVGKKYKKFIKGNFHSIGSFYSNQHPIKKKNKIDLLYISTYRPDRFTKETFFHKKYTYDYFYSRERKLIINIGKYLKKNNRVMHILSCARGGMTFSALEKKYYENFILKNNMRFIGTYKNRNNYKIMDSANILISTTSTVGYEGYGRGNKSAFFSMGPKEKAFNSSKFAWPAKVKRKGLFWSDSCEVKEVERILNKLSEISTSNWLKYKSGILKNLMIYDKDNKTFVKIMNRIKFPIKHYLVN